MIIEKNKLMFQFHKGTIKTIHCVNMSYHGAKFQFHKGTIKTLSSPY